MTQLFGRKLSLVVAPAEGNIGFDLSHMDCKFIVRRGDTQTPNSCDIRVYNLKKSTAMALRNAPNSEFSRLILNAGYQGNYGLLFDGNIKYVRPGHESPETHYLQIVAADGDSAYNKAVVNSTLAAGSTSSDHIATALKSMGAMPITPVTPGSIPGFTAKLPRAKPMFGMARDVLEDAARTNDCAWSIQDSKLQFIPSNSYLPGEAIVLNFRTGLIGFPQQTQNGLLVTSLLNPNAKIDGRIQINNASIQPYQYSLNINAQGNVQGNANPALNLDHDGFYRILWAEHEGDTRGDPWYTNMVTLALDVSYMNDTAIGKSAIADDSIVVIPNG